MKRIIAKILAVIINAIVSTYCISTGEMKSFYKSTFSPDTIEPTNHTKQLLKIEGTTAYSFGVWIKATGTINTEGEYLLFGYSLDFTDNSPYKSFGYEVYLEIGYDSDIYIYFDGKSSRDESSHLTLVTSSPKFTATNFIGKWFYYSVSCV